MSVGASDLCEHTPTSSGALLSYTPYLGSHQNLPILPDQDAHAFVGASGTYVVETLTVLSALTTVTEGTPTSEIVSLQVVHTAGPFTWDTNVSPPLPRPDYTWELTEPLQVISTVGTARMDAAAATSESRPPSTQATSGSVVPSSLDVPATPPIHAQPSTQTLVPSLPPMSSVFTMVETRTTFVTETYSSRLSASPTALQATGDQDADPDKRFLTKPLIPLIVVIILLVAALIFLLLRRRRVNGDSERSVTAGRSSGQSPLLGMEQQPVRPIITRSVDSSAAPRPVESYSRTGDAAMGGARLDSSALIGQSASGMTESGNRGGGESTSCPWSLGITTDQRPRPRLLMPGAFSDQRSSDVSRDSSVRRVSDETGSNTYPEISPVSPEGSLRAPTWHDVPDGQLELHASS